jgi:serine O-acetyltransferase
VVVFRFGQWLHGAGWRRAGAAIAWLVGRLFGLFLHPGSSIGPGLFVPHPVNVRFCGTAGANLTLYPAAAVGPEAWPRYRDRLVAEQCPTLGVGVRISARGNVVGPVTIGDNATVGIAAQVRRDLAAGLSAVPRRNWTYVTVAEPERAHEP